MYAKVRHMTIIKKQVFTRQDKTLTGRQNLIREIVAAYERLHPNEAKECQKHAKLMRGTRSRPTGEMVKGGDEVEMVHSLTLPGVLIRVLRKLIIDPPIFHEQKELRWFKREFKQY